MLYVFNPVFHINTFNYEEFNQLHVVSRTVGHLAEILSNVHCRLHVL